MLDIKLKHTALSVEHAKAQLINQKDSLPASERLEMLLVHEVKLAGQTDGRPIYLVDDLFITAKNPELVWDVEGDEELDYRWTYRDLVQYFGNSFRLVVYEHCKGWKVTHLVEYS